MRGPCRTHAQDSWWGESYYNGSVWKGGVFWCHKDRKHSGHLAGGAGKASTDGRPSDPEGHEVQ